MEIKDLINSNLIKLNCELNNKKDIIKYMANLIHINGSLICKYNCKGDSCKDYLEFEKSLFYREEQFATAIGFNFAIPHGKCPKVIDGCLSYISLKNEIQWDEDEKVKYIFMIGISSENSGNEHLQILVKLSKAIINDDFKEEIKNASDPKELLNTIIKYT